jgi:cytidylate kinase
MNELVIAIDGPSGVGKSSTSRAVAKKLGLAYLDTGSMYRAVAWQCLGSEAIDDPAACLRIASEMDMQIAADPQDPRIAVDGVDITDEIHKPLISKNVSKIATVQPIRDLLTDQMRQIVAEKKRIVLEGRDVTTVVCPDAQVRVLLQANPAVRIARREAQLNGSLDRKDLVDQVVRRDHDDATVSQFETPAPGVMLIDSTELTLDQVVARVLALVPSESK